MKPIALYHEMKAYDNFEITAERLHGMVRTAIEKHPGQPRALYLDIEGHKNAAGGFDHDATEIQQDFVGVFLAPYLTEVSTPLMKATREGQSDDLPEKLQLPSHN